MYRCSSLGRYAYQRKYHLEEEKYNPYHGADGRFSGASGAHWIVSRTGERSFGPKHPHSMEQHKIDESSSSYMDGVNDPHVMKLSAQGREKAIMHDPKVTADIKKFAKESGQKLTGLSKRIKSDQSMRRKIIAFSKELMTSHEGAASEIKDGLRYTALMPSEKYGDAVKQHIQKLKEAGYSIHRFSNTWDGSGYKGINTNIHKDGFTFELQFHTPESFAAKNKAHAYYEEQRLYPKGSKKSLELQKKMKDIFATVQTPESAGNIYYY